MKLPPRVGRPPEKLADARLLFAEGRSEEALAVLAALAARGLSADSALLRAECLAARPDPAAALRAAEEATTARGSDLARFAALRRLGDFRRHLRLGRLAADAYRAALELRPEKECRLLLSQALRDLGWLDLAVVTFAGLKGTLGGWWRQAGLSTDAALAEARRGARELLARRSDLDEAGLGRLARRLLSIGKLRGAEAARRRLPPGPEADWLAAMIAERQAWPAPRPARALDVTGDAAAGLLVDIGTWLLGGGEIERARAALSLVPADKLKGGGWQLRAALLLLAGEAEELARQAEAGARGLRPQQRAQLMLTGGIVSGRLQPLRVEDIDAAAPPPQEDLPLVLYWDKPQPPPDVEEVMATWPEQHPGLRLLRFDRAGARAYLAEHYGRRGAVAFDACPHPAVEADLLRYAVLAREGGLWSDADDACRQPWWGVLAALPPQGLCVAFATGLPFYLYNAPLAARPGNPALALALRWAMRTLLATGSGGGLNVWGDTGPGVLTRAVMEAPEGCLLLSRGLMSRLLGRADGLEYKRDDSANWRVATMDA